MSVRTRIPTRADFKAGVSPIIHGLAALTTPTDTGEQRMTDPTNPDYYRFPNGAETIDITEWLSGCGAQAVQYIARATRTDGKVKGDPIEDLSKAIWFLSRERGRLRALKGAGQQCEAWAEVPRDQP